MTLRPPIALLQVLLLCLLPLRPAAQSVIEHYRLFTVRDGLPSNEVYRLHEDNYGYLWVGTSHGLARFNGASFQNFTGFGSGLPITVCTELIQPNDSLLLAGTLSGIAVYNLKRNRFENERITDTVLALGSAYTVTCFARLPGKQLLVGAARWVAVLDEHLRVVRKKELGRPEGFFFRNAVFLDRDSTRLLAGPALLELDTRTLTYGTPAQFPRSLNSPYNTVLQALNRLGPDQYLYSFWSEGYSVYDAQKKVEKKFNITSAAGGDYNNLRDVYRDRRDSNLYWMGSGSGVVQLRLPELKHTLYTFQQRGEYNRELNYCTQVLQDNNGSTWVASRGGLVRIGRNVSAFEPLGTFRFFKEGTGKLIEYTGAVGDRQGRLWIGTYGEGLYEATAEGKYLRRFKEPNTALGHLVQNMRVFNDTLYAATFFKGLFYYDERAKNFRHPPFLPQKYKDTVSYLLHFDRWGRGWTSLNRELSVTDMRTRQFRVVQRRGDSSGIPRTPAHVADGPGRDMWFALGGWHGGLYRWDDRQQRFFNEPVVLSGITQKRLIIHQLVFDTVSQDLWIATYEHGLLRRDARSGRFVAYTQGLKSPAINALAMDAAGNLWAGTIYGLSVLVKGEHSFRTFTTDDGLPVNYIVSIAFPFQERKERLLVMMQDQLCWVNTAHLLAAQQPVKTYIEAVLVDNEPVLDRERFTFDHKHFRFRFSGVNLNNSEENRYAYLLEGHDKTWIMNSRSPFADYSGLKPGRYTFRVKTANGQGVWSEPAAYTFVITAPFWETGWFYTLAVLLLAGSIYALYGYQLSKAIALYHIRSRISKDLHDEVGSTLSSISLMNEMAVRSPEPRQLQRRIAESLASVQNAMSDIVWMVNPKNDELQNLQLRFGEVAAQLLEPKGISYTLDFPTDSGLRIPMEKRRDVFLIYKECLNNIVKYSGATEVGIEVRHGRKGVLLTVTDNGRGFDPDRPYSGNGLANMRARAVQLGGSIRWETGAGSGTKVSLWFA
ncbi:sensor histidine kinase [Flaviaesturariibacter amylovorans]|uniref:histidine kinase n=1 Tax=Flaviaesturariibacter amylovorans TaxID=1084520 RepID=A0ABP8HHX2_9BACT